jgi:hypothetical protein
MSISKRGKWRYVAIPIEMAEQIGRIVEQDHYPMGKWHSKEEFIIDCLKKTLAEHKIEKKIKKTEKEERRPTR